MTHPHPNSRAPTRANTPSEQIHPPRTPLGRRDPSPTILKRTKAPDCTRSLREDIAIKLGQ